MMWECPDFFELDGKWLLIVSPQDMLPEGFEFHNGDGTLCLMGDFDEETNAFTEQCHQAIDYGIDFYAPQTVLAPDGRRIMIGWMQNWDTCSIRSTDVPWFGQMSLPRELFVRNGRLCQKPVREINQMHQNKVVHKNVLFTDTICLEGVMGRKIDMELIQDEQFYTSLSFRPHESILKIDRKFSESRRAIIHQRRCKVESSGNELKLRIILDRFSVEVFVNEGEYVLTAAIYTDQGAEGISFFADGNVNMDVIKYDLI